MGRLTRDPEIKSSQGEKSTTIARCVAFGKSAECAEKYFRQGIKVIVTGRIQTGSYTNKDGQKVYTTDVVVEDQEFAESKATSQQNQQNNSTPASDSDGFMNIPDGIDEEMPFS